MATELGESKVKVKLDVAEAKRQIEELRKSVREGKEAPKRQAQSIAQKVAREGRDVSGGKAEEKSLTSSLLDAAGRKAKRAAVRAGGEVGGAIQAAAGASRLLPESILPVAKAAGAAALIYGAARVGTEGLLGATAAARGAGIPIPGIEDALRKLGLQFDALEAKVAGLYRGMGTTWDYAVASARLTGQAPSASALWKQSQKDVAVESEVGRLDRAFSRFKRADLASAMGKTIGDIFKQTSAR